jgi:hypothetical protein
MMTDDYVFRINGKKPFGRSKLMNLFHKMPNARVQVIDMKVHKPIGTMTVIQARQKFI